jgi:transcriptional regulator GlxA family with amidase domain
LGHPIDEPVHLAASFDLTTSAGQSWLRLSRFILAELDKPGLLDGAVVRRQYVRLLVAGLLTTQPHNYSAALADAQAPMRPRNLRRALQYIQDNLAGALSVNDIAAASGSSVRRLQEAFQDHLDASPMSYVRAQRLELARERLASGTGSVTEVAQECGFGHLGRFSASYRERFGELPSRTVTGCRR